MSQTSTPIFDRPVTEVIRSRNSARTYNGKPLTEEHRARLNAYMEDLQERANLGLRLRLIDSDIALRESGARLGTYGVIKGASSFIVPAVTADTSEIEWFGYWFEHLILFAASLGLGTCWMAMTLNRNAFAKAVALEKPEILPIVTPVGYSKNGLRPIDGIFRLAARSWSRKDWQEIFFDGDFSKPLKETAAGDYAEALETLRLAPSASNHQPWRVVKENDTFHFWLQRTKGYRDKYDYDIQRLDVGIAMCHFELTLREQGIDGAWVRHQLPPVMLPADTVYIISWERASKS